MNVSVTMTISPLASNETARHLKGQPAQLKAYQAAFSALVNLLRAHTFVCIQNIQLFQYIFRRDQNLYLLHAFHVHLVDEKKTV